MLSLVVAEVIVLDITGVKDGTSETITDLNMGVVVSVTVVTVFDTVVADVDDTAVTIAEVEVGVVVLTDEVAVLSDSGQIEVVEGGVAGGVVGGGELPDAGLAC